MATLGAGLVLTAILAAELLPAGAAPEGDAAPPPMLPTAAIVQAPPVGAWADTALERPLFAPDRRPPQSSPAVQAALPRLAGTIRDGRTVRAIFQPEGAGRPAVVARDGAVAGWIVVDIVDGMVTLARGSSTATLKLGWANLPVTIQPGAPVDQQTNPDRQP